MKICKKCRRELNETEFYPRKGVKSGLCSYCKDCARKRRQEYDQRIGYKRRLERYHNDQEFREKQIKWSTKPPGTRNEYLKAYYIKNKELMDHRTREYRRNNRDKLNEWCREYYKDPAKRIARNMYNRVRIAIFTQLAEKSQKTEYLCGCSWEDLVKHIEAQFKEGMAWDNYGLGKGKWSIDHIKPCILYDLTDSQEQKECFHYTNLQPLWSIENSSKREKYN